MPARTTTTARLATAKAFARAVRTASRPGSAGVMTRLAAMPRLVSAVRRREYLGASNGQVLGLLGAALYVASPVDVLPEGLLGVFGIGDDAMLLAFAASAFVNLTEDFLAWEAAGGDAGRAAPRDASSAYHGPANGFFTGDTVPGNVVR